MSSGEKFNPVTFSRPKDPYNNGIMSNSLLRVLAIFINSLYNFIFISPIFGHLESTATWSFFGIL